MVTKITEGKVIRRKKTLSSRFREMFFGGDTKGVFEYITGDVMVPALKELIADSVNQGIERMIFGETRISRRNTRSSSFGNGNVVNYSRYSSNNRRERDDRTRPPNPSPRSRSSSSHAFDDIILDSRAEAEKILDKLADIVKRYEFASVRDLYEAVGETFHNVDEKWGWYDLRGAYIRRVSNGYLLSLPETEEISD